MRIAAFGFRSLPSRPGCAGADKVMLELLTRLASAGHDVIGYNRLYPGEDITSESEGGVRLKHFRTVKKKGFDTLLHSTKCTWDIIRHNTGEVVHITNGGNSIFALILRLFGKRTFVSQDGIDWERDKWPWYGRMYLTMSTYLTAFGPTQVIFDNVFVKQLFENRFRREYEFIPFGSEVAEEELDNSVLEELGLKEGEYLLFVGRFIPDKGLQYLIPAFEGTSTNKKLVLVGGSPNPSAFETKLRSTKDPRIVFPGFVYGRKAHALMKSAYCYVQPSDVEGLSPVILENMGLGTPVICSDIQENKFVVGKEALLFRQGDTGDCRAVLERALSSPEEISDIGRRGQNRALSLFSWDAVTAAHERVFSGQSSGLALSVVDH